MTATTPCPAPTLETGAFLHGFKVVRVQEIPDIRVRAYEMIHEATGAIVLHLHCHDLENLFAVGFRTPPEDSTGLPHILEHSVLAGSMRYPLKDVFNELLKGSLQTFLNAFTYPDKTLYPVASRVRTDFFNLARVYSDLVLRPRLLRETLAQEGHHLELTGDDLTLSGVVYNEMKGAYASPDSLMFKAIQENLFPDTVYAFDSGGNPDDIPALTYEQFRAYHHRYYSPANARFFLYGDIPTEEHLAFLEGILAGFQRTPVDSAIGAQETWQAPRTVRGTYPVNRGEDLKGKTAVNVAWMLAENTDGETAVLLEILAGILVGSAAGPLRKALIDSGYGEDLSPVTGLERDFRQIVFAAGLRGSDAERADSILSLMLETLKRCVRDGFDPDLIEGTLHQVEFHGKEMIRKAYPYGIVLMGRAYHTWLYDGDPLAGLNFPKIIADIRGRWRDNPRLFQDLIQRWFLDNPHRLLSVLEPSPTFQEERETAFRRKMAAVKASLSAEDLEKVRSGAEALKAFQSAPDPPEAAASLPRLHVGDLNRLVETIPTAWRSAAGVPVMVHDLFANGIVYLDLAFDVSDLPEDLQPYLPLLGKLTLQMGAAGLNYEAMAKRITLKTGGLGCSLSAGLTRDGRGDWQRMVFSVKALHRNIPDALAIVADILTAGDLLDETRMRDLVMEKRNRLHAAVVPSGHTFAKMTAGAALSAPAHRDEQWHGRHQLRFLTRTADRLSTEGAQIRAAFQDLRRRLFTRERLLLNVTGDEEGIASLLDGIGPLLDGLGSSATADAAAVYTSPVHVGIGIPADVSYVAKVLPAPAYDHALAPPLLVLARYLSNGILYKQIRVQGGAYGGMSQLDLNNGLFAFLSYRDPHIARTLDAYQAAEDLVASQGVTEEDLEKALIGTIGGLDRPMDPSGRGYAAMLRHFSGITDADRQRFRSAILEMTPAVLRDAATAYFAEAGGRAVTAVFASEDNLRRANEALPLPLQIEALTDG